MLIAKITTPKRMMFGLASSLGMFVFFMTIAIGSDIDAVLSNGLLNYFQKATVLAGLYVNPFNYMHVVNFVVMILVSLLVGIQVMLHRYIYQARKRVVSSERQSFKSSTYISGLFVSLGMGCAACGSLVLVSVFSALGLGVSIAMTMWVSNILMIAAFILLSYTNIKLYKQAKNPLVCPI